MKTRYFMPWWLVPDYDQKPWSQEEKNMWMAIWLLSVIMFLISYILLMRIFVGLNVNSHVLAFADFLISLPLGICLARALCTWLWPATMRRADENATKRRARA